MKKYIIIILFGISPTFSFQFTPDTVCNYDNYLLQNLSKFTYLINNSNSSVVLDSISIYIDTLTYKGNHYAIRFNYKTNNSSGYYIIQSKYGATNLNFFSPLSIQSNDTLKLSLFSIGYCFCLTKTILTNSSLISIKCIFYFNNKSSSILYVVGTMTGDGVINKYSLKEYKPIFKNKSINNLKYLLNGRKIISYSNNKSINLCR